MLKVGLGDLVLGELGDLGVVHLDAVDAGELLMIRHERPSNVWEREEVITKLLGVTAKVLKLGRCA